MILSPTTPTDSPARFAPRTPRMIGRKALVDAIRAAITDESGRSHVLYFVGPGGMGKTRLLEEVAVIRKARPKRPFRWTGIIDLYHAGNHSPSGLRQAIIDGLDPDKHFFREYRVLREIFEQKRQEGITGPTLEELRRRLDKVFQEEYAVLAAKQRLVLSFDTLELIQYESDIVQDIGNVRDVDTVIKNWFLKQVSQFPNTVTLFAGRPRPKVQADFEQGFTQARQRFELFELQAFNQTETQAYLKAMRERRPELAEMLTPEVRKRVFQITQGRPIYLALLIDLMLQGELLNDIFPLSDKFSPSEHERIVNKRLVEHLRNLPSPFGEMIYFLIYARKGLDADLLRHLMHNLWSETEIQKNLSLVGEFAFVKTRPETAQLFLHDEVYDMFDRYFQDDPLYRREYELFAKYYRQRVKDMTPLLSATEELAVARLYYELQIDVRAGYYNYYVRWDEDAIKGHETGFDMHLRDEALRFLDRYSSSDSPFYDKQIADRVDRAAIDRDCAVRWGMRYLAHSEFLKACQVAENLRNSTHPTFNWETVDDPLYKAGLLAIWSNALVLTGAQKDRARSLHEEVFTLLADDREWSEYQRWLRASILGRAHESLGYLYRTEGRYGLALQEYRRALPYFNEVMIRSERASTLNNLAYLLALLGRVNQAVYHIEQALEIRQELKRRYPLALSYNTRGIIYALQDHPIWGERECHKALEICETLQEPRGIGLACNGLGFALRRHGDQWKQGIFTHQEADAFFGEADSYFRRAEKIFSDQVPEPIRLWEVYNELGSLYCDWGWLNRHRPNGDRATLQKALEQYDRSIDYQNKALAIAQDRNLAFQIADSYDDLAQVYGDRSFLLFEMGRVPTAKESRATAEAYLEQAEAMVPQEFRLVSGEGFRQAPEAGEAYWLSLGKASLWRGIWAFRDLEAGIISDDEREQTLEQAIDQFILSAIYFLRYWPQSFALEHTLDRMGRFLQRTGVSSERTRERVRVAAEAYRVDLSVVEEAVGDMLGL